MRFSDSYCMRFFEQLEQVHHGRLGLHARHLSSGKEISHRADEPFPMASTFKIPIATALLVQVDQGVIDLETLHAIEQLSPGTGLLRKCLRVPGVALSTENLLTLMLTHSDNTATDQLIRALGGPQAINDILAKVCVHKPHITRTCHQSIAEYYGLEPNASLEEIRAFASTVQDMAIYDEALKAEKRDVATAREMTDLLSRLAANELTEPCSTQRLMDIMADNQTGSARIRAKMPPGVWVADKTGTLGKHLANDTGYIGWKSSEIAITCFTWSEADGLVEALIADAARTVFDLLSE